MKQHLKWAAIPFILLFTLGATVEPGLKIWQYPNRPVPSDTAFFVLSEGGVTYNVSAFQLRSKMTQSVATVNYVITTVTNAVFVAPGSTNVAIVTNRSGSTVTYTVYATNDGGGGGSFFAMPFVARPSTELDWNTNRITQTITTNTTYTFVNVTNDGDKRLLDVTVTAGSTFTLPASVRCGGTNTFSGDGGWLVQYWYDGVATNAIVEYRDFVPARGTLFVGDGNAIIPFTAGSDGQIIVFDSTQTGGIKATNQQTITATGSNLFGLRGSVGLITNIYEQIALGRTVDSGTPMSASNRTDGLNASILGGRFNSIDTNAEQSVILGGEGNTQNGSGTHSAILGGSGNSNNGDRNFLAGSLNAFVANIGYSGMWGGLNTINGSVSDFYTVWGESNTAGWTNDVTSKDFMNILGGSGNFARDEYTWIIGKDVVNNVANSFQVGFNNTNKTMFTESNLFLVGNYRFRQTNGATDGYVFTSDANGVASWAAATLGATSIRTNQFTTNIDNTPVVGQLWLSGTNGFIDNTGATRRLIAMEYNPMRKSWRWGSLGQMGGNHAYLQNSNFWDDPNVGLFSQGWGSNILVNANFSAVLGGNNNQVYTNASNSVIVAGKDNVIKTNAHASVIGGGEGNLIGHTATYGTIAGGHGNLMNAPADHGTISGGHENDVNATYGTIGGGFNNAVLRSGGNPTYGTIAGGGNNSVQGEGGAIGGGAGNSIIANGVNSTVGGGGGNIIGESGSPTTYAGILGGANNTIKASGDFSFIGGGEINSNEGGNTHAVIGGGRNNLLEANAGDYASIVGGRSNYLSGDYSFIGGGMRNYIQDTSVFSFILGGFSNQVANADFAGAIGWRQTNTSPWTIDIGATMPGIRGTITVDTNGINFRGVTNLVAGTITNLHRYVGRVRLATGQQNYFITNNLVTVNTIVTATINSDDTTATSVKAIPSAGLLTLKTIAAATADTDISFQILTP